jgi:hypothetical protein
MRENASAERERIDVDYRVQVAYTVPVEAIIDLQEGRVDRVVVMDEEVALDEEEGARQEGSLHPISTAVAKRAIEVAEAGEWPVWEQGF